jgi:ribonucleoside-diphosphate reductase alpha chain
VNRNALAVLERRYLLRDEQGRTLETPRELFRRVARAVADADRRHDGEAAGARMEEAYVEAMQDLRFLPNSPTLMNAGTSLGQLAACFVLPVGDSLGEIFGAVRDAALIHQSGGGTGFSFSRLRMRGDRVRETGGVASGPVSFMRVFDVATDVIRQGGRRRGANMGVLDVSHPDIFDFIHAKDDAQALRNFNLSVAVSDAFLHALDRGEAWPLVNPRDGRVVRSVDPLELWRQLAAAAWRSGEPGVLFLDEIERRQPTPALGRIEATNPCGEQPLLPHEACTLGSINLARLVGEAGFDWARLESLARLGVRFLDGVLDVSEWPLPEIAARVRANRKLGLGVMGLADAVARLGVPYASEEALDFTRRVMRTVTGAGRAESAALAERRGAFPNFAASIWPGRGSPPLRNATVSTVAPTGTLGILAGTSSGIEPFFALAYVRRALDGTELPEVSAAFVAELERRGLPVDEIVERVSATGSARDVPGVPAELARRFPVAQDIAPEWHVRMQAAAQEHTDNAVSKTANLPEAAGVDDVRAVFDLARNLKCKGITVYRTHCRPHQVLDVAQVPGFAVREAKATAAAEFAGECRRCST